MKSIKKTVLCILLVVLLLSLSACYHTPKKIRDLTLPELSDNEMTIVIKNGKADYTIYTVDLSVFDESLGYIFGSMVLEYLRDERGLALDWVSSPDGFLIIGIGSLTADMSNGEIILEYTNNTDYHYAALWGRKERIYDVGDVRLKLSASRVSNMRIAPGDVIYFELDKFDKK